MESGLCQSTQEQMGNDILASPLCTPTLDITPVDSQHKSERAVNNTYPKALAVRNPFLELH